VFYSLSFKTVCTSGLGVRRVAVRGDVADLLVVGGAHALAQRYPILDIPGSTVDENLAASVGDMGSIPAPGRSPQT